jgi:hypothetical protein
VRRRCLAARWWGGVGPLAAAIALLRRSLAVVRAWLMLALVSACDDALALPSVASLNVSYSGVQRRDGWKGRGKGLKRREGRDEV